MLSRLITISIFITALSVLVFFNAFSVRTNEMTESEILNLAEDAYFVVGDVHLIVPMVAVREPVKMVSVFVNDKPAWKEWKRARDEFTKSTSDPSNPLTSDMIKVGVRAFALSEALYGDAGKTMCGRLTRRWARSICHNPEAPLIQAFPPSFDLILSDAKNIGPIARTHTSSEVEKDKIGNIKGAEIGARDTIVICGTSSDDIDRLCIAALPIKGSLVAIWNVNDKEGETAEAEAKRQEDVVLAFVIHGLGLEENFDALQAVACKSMPSDMKHSNDQCP